MAYTIDFTDPETGHPRYNFDFSIGTATRGDDVQLLQVLLNMLYFDLADQSRPRGFIPPRNKRLVEDGKIGERTIELVEQCYTRMLKIGENLAPLDSVASSQLDPMRRPGERSHIMHVNYFIDVLNDDVSVADSDAGLGRYPLLAFDPTVPDALRNALKTVKTTASQYEFEE